jgi:hypothetical protein
MRVPEKQTKVSDLAERRAREIMKCSGVCSLGGLIVKRNHPVSSIVIEFWSCGSEAVLVIPEPQSFE